ncbi:hypothetical protein K504DRAFT_118551 [Pleomassaria siparia CBS 279.74]|uniref:Transmembrane protein n=1 Tax=Pleomassaria siparia CBS 279.74 TaxID=1314801 RepID=A0A6G1JWI2_9PLEO|nr:hypothetical protein K504DRAFT_118551 [Pleomassaria siparia CBS 279.74]
MMENNPRAPSRSPASTASNPTFHNSPHSSHFCKKSTSSPVPSRLRSSSHVERKNVVILLNVVLVPSFFYYIYIYIYRKDGCFWGFQPADFLG